MSVADVSSSSAAAAPAAAAETTAASALAAADESGAPTTGLSAPTDDAAPLLPAAPTSSLNVSSLPQEITSPHQLTDWVDAALNRLESQFSTLNRQYEARSQEMSDRIDDLEKSITSASSRQPLASVWISLGLVPYPLMLTALARSHQRGRYASTSRQAGIADIPLTASSRAYLPCAHQAALYCYLVSRNREHYLTRAV